MATAGSAERPGAPARAAAGRSRSGPGARCRSGSGAGPPEDEGTQRAEARAGHPARGHPARGLSGSEERPRSSGRPGRRAGAGRTEVFVSPLIPKSSDLLSGSIGKHKPPEEREELRRRNESGRWDAETGVRSDSENEEPIGRRIRNISAFVRRTRNSSSVSGAQRSRSCTDPVEERGGKLKVSAQPALMDRVGISHSFTAGILLSSENSRSVSAPITAPGRLPWRAVVSSSTPLALPPPRPERSISPESNDSISEELNHFKPIVCSPCTPPKRLPDGRLLEPLIVKSTPRNLTRGLQRATTYEASPAVLQKWRQIELDRQSLKVNSRATLTSPVSEPPAPRPGQDVPPPVNKRRLLFDPPGDADAVQKQSVRIRVPAIRYSGEALRAGPDLEGAAESGGTGGTGGTGPPLRRSFSPYSKSSGFQLCRLLPQDPQSPRKEPDHPPTSRRGKKRKQKTKHLDPDRDPDPKRTRPGSVEAFDERLIRQIQQERQDRVLALKLQRQFDLENQTSNRRRSPDQYFLRSWMSNQNRRRRGLRRSRRISKKH